MQTKTIQEWTAHAKTAFKDYIFYDGFCLDITQFSSIHPGGAQVIKNYLFKDVTNILFTVFPHNQHTTPKLLQKYRIGMLSQQPTPRVRIQGNILKQRKDQRENGLMKKSVHFPSQVKKLASEKQRKQEMKKSRKDSKSKPKNTTPLKPCIFQNGQDKKSKRTKNINQDYLQALKGSKAPVKPTKSEQKLQEKIDKIKQELTIKKQLFCKHRFDSGELENIEESTLNVSIKKYLQKSWGSFQEYVEEAMPAIKVPVMNVKFNRVW